MTWFKVDDNYWSHPKVLLTPLDVRGMWVSAGSWCAQHLTDGFIPDEILKRIMPVRPKQVDALTDRLETTGLWTHQGDDWHFHDWQAYQPIRTQVEEERRTARERQRQWRALNRRTPTEPEDRP